ncbi:CGNR zinc finger domain-containing protein [Kineococcus rubinsiae]|uniref:CGNR zinc finger domain-containing protein n=1 Tax=Kineococcus rubinsiae TaxID=2609562 RepID=UPI0014317473|nr:CGNR zinc finger domain-containing protein [Kineococcus rubinsiae]NIZ90250.1 CGNR zinc finger domain-containing protein [Kineococcus rubinsiae]
MLFTHDTTTALQAAVDLVNTAEPPDTLTTAEQLDAWYAGFGYTGRHEGSAAELAAVRDVRPQVRELLTSERDHGVALLNRVLAQAAAVPQLVRHDALDWHVHAVAPETGLATRILVETAMAMIDVVRADEGSRLSVCADDGCSGVVLDLSRNRSRRYCSTACGNRNAVAAYRARRAAPS